MPKTIKEGSDSAKVEVAVRTKQTRRTRAHGKNNTNVRPGFQSGDAAKGQRSFTAVKPEGFAGHVPHDASLKHRREVARVVHADPEEELTPAELRTVFATLALFVAVAAVIGAVLARTLG